MNYLKELADKIHENSVNKGFWNTELSDEHCLCLVVSELMESVEADRKGRFHYYKKFNKELEKIEGSSFSEKISNILNKINKKG